jgi:hypothetical protein
MSEPVPPSSPRHVIVPVNDELAARRASLKSKARLLQKYVHFESAVRPHMAKQAQDLADLRATELNQEREVTEMQQEIQRIKEGAPPPINREERDANLERIRQLEVTLQGLLKDKAGYLVRASDAADIDFPPLGQSFSESV